MKIECPFLSQLPCLKHGFFEYDPHILTTATKTMSNRPLPLITLKQIHSNKVIHVTEPLREVIEADGLVTHVKGIALGILSADCGPILFYDPITQIIGACHAGWRGAKDGIIQATLKEMEEQGAIRSQIYATLGPTIQQSHYEVGPEFPAFFPESYERYFYPSSKEGFHYFNLPRYLLDQLSNEGLTHIHDLEQNTFTTNFLSRRRLLSQGFEKPSFANNLSAIAIT